jgi:hypothetical protein
MAWCLLAKPWMTPLNVVHRASQSTAAAAVNKLAAHLAAGTDRLASLVRNAQDLAAEAEALDKVILAAVSKEPAKRDAAAEQRIRDRLAEIAKQRVALRGVFAAEFPNYAALSNPQPPAVKDIQALLSDGEALHVYATGDKESYVFAVTSTSAAWTQTPIGTAALSEKVAAFRRGLDVEALSQSAESGRPVLFDLGLANELYVSLVGPVEDLVKDARHVLVVPSGPLTSLPFHLLVTGKPANAIPQLKDIGSYRDAAWLIKRQAVSMLPALSSLKALRQAASRDPGAKPLVGFADPVFDPAERARTLAERRAERSHVAMTRGYGDFWQGANIDRAKLAKYLPSLLDTADELKAVAAKVGAAPRRHPPRQRRQRDDGEADRAGRLSRSLLRDPWPRCRGCRGARRTLSGAYVAEAADGVRRRPAHRKRGGAAQAQCRLGGAVGLQHRRGQQARRGGAVRACAGLLLCRRPGASCLALVGRFGGGHPAHHLDIRHHEGRFQARPRRGPARCDAGLHERQGEPAQRLPSILGAVFHHW